MNKKDFELLKKVLIGSMNYKDDPVEQVKDQLNAATLQLRAIVQGIVERGSNA